MRITSDENTISANNQVEIAYQLENIGTDTITVEDYLLNTVDATRERAESIFLEQSYQHIIIEVETYFVSGIEIGMILKYNDTLYKIYEINYEIEGAVALMILIAKRWI